MSEARPSLAAGTTYARVVQKTGATILTAKDSEVQLISLASLDTGTLARLWENVVREGSKAEVIETMRILEPTLNGIDFLPIRHNSSIHADSGILASVGQNRKPVPLGSLGDGMRRLLALAMALIRCKGGVLLLDEIDTGFHYSIMGALWRFVVEAARTADVQLFATTHSLDCIRGLAWLCENHPELGAEVSLQKMDRRLKKAVALHAEQIVMAWDQNMEVR